MINDNTNIMKTFSFTSAVTCHIKKYFASEAEAITWGNQHFEFFKVSYRLWMQDKDWQWREITVEKMATY